MPVDKRHRHPPRKQKSSQEPTSDVIGVQKIKAALRQTRRLLAKDNLAADKRIETERRLKSLLNDLEVAESNRKERALATRYHKIKFFEKTKVMRKIKQCKREIVEQDTQSSKHAATELENRLFELRSQLHYILHFPKLEKYISLFPGSNGDDDVQPTDDTTSERRQEILGDIQDKMRQGILGSQPEEASPEEKLSARAMATGVKNWRVQEKGPALEGGRMKRKGRMKGMDSPDKPFLQRDSYLQEDDFFEPVNDFE